MMGPRWYVLRSKPRREEVVWQQLLARHFETFYPRIHVQSSRGRATRVKPYFPGYLFVRADLEHTGITPLQWIPHTIGLVCFDGTPAEVPDSLIAALKRHVREVSAAGSELLYKLKAGDVVEIKEGPFTGYEAIFDTRLSGRDRVRVLLQLLNERVVPLELDANSLKQKTTTSNGDPYRRRR